MTLSEPVALGSTLLLLGLLTAASCSRRLAPEDLQPGLIESSYVPTQTPPASPELIDLGGTTYAKECVACHGLAGDGEGEAAYLLYPRPRDFTTRQYRLISTWDGVPTDEDLFRTISRGMPGSAMPSWAHLPEQTRWGLVHYLKTLSKRPLEVKPNKEPGQYGAGGAGVIAVPAEPAGTPEGQARARELFRKGCAPCHGPEGRGDGQQQQVDSKGYPTRPRDLTLGVYKGSPKPDQVYRRIVAELPGSPMPQSGYLHGDDAWQLVRFVRLLSSDEQRAKAEMKKFRIVAPRVAGLPVHPDSGIWRTAPAVNLHLMPLWWRTDRPEEITVQAVHEGGRIALLLRWGDETEDASAIRSEDFRGAAAVEFASCPTPRSGRV